MRLSYYSISNTPNAHFWCSKPTTQFNVLLSQSIANHEVVLQSSYCILLTNNQKVFNSPSLLCRETQSIFSPFKNHIPSYSRLKSWQNEMRYPPASLSDELIVYVMLLVLVLYLSPGKWTLDDKKISVFSCKIGIYTMYLINVVVKIKKNICA